MKSNLVENLKHGPCVITFEKVSDGSKRTMRATLSESLVHEPVTIPDGELITVWDLENNAWRSFYANTVENWAPEW